MTTRTNSSAQLEQQALQWKRRRDVPLAILAWIALAAVILWTASHITRAILLLVVAALFAYALAPLVGILQRFMPRVLAVLIVYLLFLGAISAFVYLIINTTIEQVASLSQEIRYLLNPGPNGSLSPLEQTLGRFGISAQEIAQARQQIIAQSEAFVSNSVPLARSVINFAFDTIVMAVLSIYLLLDGPRAANWIRRNAPNVTRANFFLDIMQRVVGGYIRGQFTLAVLIGLLVGLGMGLIFHLPYAVFLGVVAFAMAFIPVLGTFVSGAICVAIGLTHGWLIALGVLIYFIAIHILEGDVIGPRIVGQAVGLHPIASLLALVAGAELFGIWGALFASPLAGVLQAIMIAYWYEWRSRHPEHFASAKQEIAEQVTAQQTPEEEQKTTP